MAWRYLKVQCFKVVKASTFLCRQTTHQGRLKRGNTIKSSGLVAQAFTHRAVHKGNLKNPFLLQRLNGCSASKGNRYS